MSSATSLTSSAITASTPAGLPGQIGGSHQHPIETFVIGTDQKTLAGRPLGASRVSADRQAPARRPLRSTTADSMAGPIPSRIGQSEARSPSNGRPRTSSNADRQESASSESARRDKAIPIGADRVGQGQPSVRVREVVEAVPRLPERPTGHRGRRMKARRRHQPVGPQCGCPRLVGGAVGVHGQVDDELLGPCPGEISRRATDLDVAENRHFDLPVLAPGQRRFCTVVGSLGPCQGFGGPGTTRVCLRISGVGREDREGNGEAQIGLVRAERGLAIGGQLYQRCCVHQLVGTHMLRNDRTKEVERGFLSGTREACCLPIKGAGNGNHRDAEVGARYRFA